MPRFPETSCSQCGETFGPGDSGFSHCDQHAVETILRKLVNEVAGCWSVYEPELRQVMGHTNFNCVALRVEEAQAALTKGERE